MREFQERRRVKKLLHSRYAIAALLIIAVILVRAVWNAYDKYERSKEVAGRTSEEYQALQEREKALSASLSALNTEEGREREVRDRFGAVKEGEKLIILVDDAAAQKPQAAAADKSVWQRIKEFFTRD